ncbi:hypothetical protein AB1Y20_007526 [Prymnesium parvum]|uniref:Uncharacterized protein n=1 Tax=Prymnesium parvum TaxID=97485 RepID=A0AB34IXQ9_PRYPA
MRLNALAVLWVASAWTPAEACCKREFLERHSISTTLAVSAVNRSKREGILAQLAAAWSHVPPHMHSALHLEFGVRDGGSTRFLANLTGPAVRWDAFDSFEGLPESGGPALRGWRKGSFSRHGKLPEVPAHVRLHKGWFNETVPPFLDAELAADPRRAIAYMNMDADLYSSTKTIFDAVFSRCMHRRGTVITFDELFGTAAILEHEWRALMEAQKEHGFTFHFISYFITTASPFVRAAIQLDECGTRCASTC